MIHYKSKELANKEKDEVNDNGVETNKGHKSDMKSTRKSVIKEQYKSRLRDKYGWQSNEGLMCWNWKWRN